MRQIYSQHFQIYLANTVHESQFSQLLVNLCESTRECWRTFSIRLFSAIKIYVVPPLNEFEMALSQSETLARKRKAEAKCYKCIMEDPDLHNACHEKR